MTKNCWNSQALAEISCYLAFAGAMLYLVRSGRYLSYVTPKLAPYLCFSAAVMVVWALSSLVDVRKAPGLAESAVDLPDPILPNPLDGDGLLYAAGDLKRDTLAPVGRGKSFTHGGAPPF